MSWIDLLHVDRHGPTIPKRALCEIFVPPDCFAPVLQAIFRPTRSHLISSKNIKFVKKKAVKQNSDFVPRNANLGLHK